ncbi:uncharacterized protein SPPG_08891 [Spizellomyces punctatus DAOM BR117]|uniref:HNH nuclease domain-containing protein n=1 Tax=Spizellomyces punctatus (strain DAOM BR117) TaxID=645134 RepID=A0A0L0HRD8_SPIPD|nr:uncharacterized protein SPPG_08891 [Spizellomyces punctatus DAOM BR117]KND03444.1 hypothetical protein SPPG_08891 [Spizellomyces punctatus DAOM BR117]|eukprot:XP_016611483.1 hypothetical protein SPPG_08891 [Spizellomyces punctatus DAOM BR117]
MRKMRKWTPANRRVVRIELDDSETEFRSINAAAKSIGVSQPTLWYHFKKHGNTQFRYRGYEWKYANQDLMLQPGEYEVWFDHPTLPVKVSSHGRIEHANGGRTFGYIGSNGYMQVMIKYKNYLIHRIVGDTFYPDEKHSLLKHCSPEIDHIDGNTKNNRADNLEWVTRYENQRRAIVMLANRKRKRQEEKSSKLQINVVLPDPFDATSSSDVSCGSSAGCGGAGW